MQWLTLSGECARQRRRSRRLLLAHDVAEDPAEEADFIAQQQVLLWNVAMAALAVRSSSFTR
jgi:hypothetical protein